MYCEINETILGPCSGGIWTLVMKIKGSEVRSVKQILQLNPIVFLLKAFSYPEPAVSLLANSEFKIGTTATAAKTSLKK